MRAGRLAEVTLSQVQFQESVGDERLGKMARAIAINHKFFASMICRDWMVLMGAYCVHPRTTGFPSDRTSLISIFLSDGRESGTSTYSGGAVSRMTSPSCLNSNRASFQCALIFSHTVCTSPQRPCHKSLRPFCKSVSRFIFASSRLRSGVFSSIGYLFSARRLTTGCFLSPSG
jgi:hypothetical protein